MSAGCLVNNKSVSVTDCHKACGNDSGTVIVAKRQRSYGKYSKIFIHGSGIGYRVRIRGSSIGCRIREGDHVTYTQDTGNGYKCNRYDLEIENIIEFDDNGNFSSLNDIGLNEKRRLWVMK